jgi:SAM-dependent methyltransferase
MDKKWVRTPKHVLRTKCIESLVQAWQPGSFVEFGAGTGDITSHFLDWGYHGKCYDLGAENRAVLRANLAAYGDAVEIVDDPANLGPMQFDYLFAFEVLEHISDDAKAFQDWSKHLKTGGKVLISVPAHQSKYSEEDKWAGHVRRYEKQQLMALLEKTGYTDITILNYGFPLGNITRMVSRLLHRRASGPEQALTPEQRSIRSGVERIGKVNRLAFFGNELLLFPFTLLQAWFYQRDWGDGYVACAVKSASQSRLATMK